MKNSAIEEQRRQDSRMLIQTPANDRKREAWTIDPETGKGKDGDMEMRSKKRVRDGGGGRVCGVSAGRRHPLHRDHLVSLFSLAPLSAVANQQQHF